jgi:hypothetical protein
MLSVAVAVGAVWEVATINCGRAAMSRKCPFVMPTTAAAVGWRLHLADWFVFLGLCCTENGSYLLLFAN